MNGWIKLHRQFMEWEWYSDNNVKSVFIHCLLMANIENKEWRGVNINRGSFISSISNIASTLGLSIKAVRIAINKLKNTSEILTEGANQWTMITICKYEEYQSLTTDEGQTNGTPKGKRGANEGQTRGKRGATTKEYKEREELENVNIDVENSTSSYTTFMSIYDLFIKDRTGGPAKINKRQGAAAKKIIDHLKRSCQTKNPNVNDDDILGAWKLILNSYKKWELFHQKQLELNQIESNLINIINSIKNGKSINGKQPATSPEDIDRLVDYVAANHGIE